MNDFDYSKFIEFLKEGLHLNDENTLNDMETLIEFYEGYPPEELEEEIDSDYAKEEIERIAKDTLVTLLPKLKKQEQTWLTVENGKFILFKGSKAQNKKQLPKSIEDELIDDELKLVKKHYDELTKVDRESILDIYDHKYMSLGTVEERYELLDKLFNSYKNRDEKDYNYLKLMKRLALIIEENKGKALDWEAYKYHEDAAKFHRQKYDHDESANEFKKAADIISEIEREQRDVYATLKNKHLRLVRSMRIQYELFGDEKNASEAFIKECEINRLILGKSKKSWIHIISDNCQNPFKVAMTALCLVAISTIIFSLTGIEGSGFQSLLEGNKAWYLVIWDSFYFSIVTLTTLGYGDFSPGNGLSRLVANIISILGLILSSLFLVTLVRKYGR